MNDKIDAVILFVDMNDEEWKDGYNKFVEAHEIPNKYINNDTRFRDYGSLRGVLRSIDTYAPWINNLFLVVQRESQVPKWINRDTVKVVLHEEFIPNEYLPTYNCNTIETHLHFIPGLSEKFIYFNDDTFLNTVVYPEDFFIGNKCVDTIVDIEFEKYFSGNVNEKFYKKLRFNNTKVFNEIYKDKHSIYRTIFNSHGPTPLFKSLCEEIYHKIDMKKHMSPFRTTNNLTQELFTIYELLHRRLILLKNATKKNKSNNNPYTVYSSKTHEKFKDNFINNMSKTYCINDSFKNDFITDDIFIIGEVNKIISIRFPNKSKYEKRKSSIMCNR